MTLKKTLDDLVLKYETVDFIDKDPIRFPHMFSSSLDIELSGIISSAFAYGKRELFIKKLEVIFTKIMKNNPSEFIMNFDLEKDFKYFENFKYRYTKGCDVCLLLNSLKKAVEEYSTLENLFMKGFSADDKNVKQALIHFTEVLYEYNKNQPDIRGFKFLLPSPKANSACKRLNMFLRWMVRKSEVDFNLWKNIPQSKLIIPLDVHVARVSRGLGLILRNQNDWQAAEILTEVLKQFDENDPVKYDFALFDMGVDKVSLEEIK